MAWTQAQLDSLERAIAEGALIVKYEDRVVTYRSLGEMSRLRRTMRVALGIQDDRPDRVRVTINKDLLDPWGSTAPYISRPPWFPL
jgi:hypothetical protein